MAKRIRWFMMGVLTSWCKKKLIKICVEEGWASEEKCREAVEILDKICEEIVKASIAITLYKAASEK